MNPYERKREARTRKMLFRVAGVLLLAAVFTGAILIWKISMRLEKEKNETASLQIEIQSLRKENEELKEKLEQAEKEKESPGEEADQVMGAEAEDGLGAMKEMTGSSENVLDMEGIPSGTVMESDRIDTNNLEQYFCAYRISDEILQRINGQSYRENNNIGLDDLRYLKVLHYNFEHQIQMGELIVNVDVSEDFVQIFKELFEAEYEIESMYLIDNYWTGEGDSSDTASIEENNTSAFCYRTITGGSNLSNHAYGRAIDINPQQNPYVSYRSGNPVWTHENANDYIARDTGLPHVITHDDICYQIFTKYGFSWGGDWNTIKDYQHFEKEF